MHDAMVNSSLLGGEGLLIGKEKNLPSEDFVYKTTQKVVRNEN